MVTIEVGKGGLESATIIAARGDYSIERDSAAGWMRIHCGYPQLKGAGGLTADTETGAKLRKVAADAGGTITETEG